MKKSLIYLFLLTIVFASCQKEPSTELPNSGVPTQPGNGNRLQKIVYQYSATDSVYTEFFYDTQGRWMGQRTTGDDFAIFTSSTEIRVIRNPNGYITQYTVTEPDAAGFPENTTYTVHYDVNAKRYTSRVSEVELNGNILVDSTVFLVNNGRMASQRFLYKQKATGLYLEVGKLEFLYDGAGNPITVGTYSSNAQNTALEKVGEVSLQFDNKNAALNLGVEALVMDQLFFASPNNVTRLAFKDLADPANPTEELINILYQYNGGNRPKEAEVTVDGDSIPMYFRYG